MVKFIKSGLRTLQLLGVNMKLYFQVISFFVWTTANAAPKTQQMPMIMTVNERGDFIHEHVPLKPMSGSDQMAKYRSHRTKKDSGFIGTKHVAGRSRHWEFFDARQDERKSDRRHHGRVKRQATGNFIVETVVILDYPVYRFWLRRNRDDRTSTLQEMTDYYSNVINAVNRRYESLETEGFNIHLAVNAYLVAETPAATPWTQNLNMSNQIQADDALDNLEDFLQSTGGFIGGVPYDHAFIITGFDLIRGSSASTVGLASFYACNVRSGSLSEDLRSEFTPAVIAHEVGHALSSLHDGDGNSCNGSVNYVMSPILATPPREEACNPWKFSSCSSSAIKTFLATPSASCTTTLAGSPQDLSPFLTEPFGQKYPADVQCEIYLGESSKFCRTLYTGNPRTFDDMCRRLYCADPGSNFCFPVLAHDGTSCGSKKWCQTGLCVPSSDAPATPENCPAGDDPDVDCTAQSCSDPLLREYLCCATCGPVVTMATRGPTTASVMNRPTTASLMKPPRRVKTTASLYDRFSRTTPRMTGRSGTTASLYATPPGVTPRMIDRSGTTASLYATPPRTTPQMTDRSKTTASLYLQLSSTTPQDIDRSGTTASLYVTAP